LNNCPITRSWSFITVPGLGYFLNSKTPKCESHMSKCDS
jgi:hypothetical protein